MDPEKVLKFLTENLANWSWITALTLRNPIARFELVPIPFDHCPASVSETSGQRNLWLHPKLISYAVFSIVIGVAMNSLLPGRLPEPDLLEAVTIVFAYWLICGSFLFLVCWSLKGRGSYLDTLSVSIQVFAAIYVITSFTSLVAVALVSVSAIAEIVKKVPLVGELIVDTPVLLFFIIGTTLLSIYVPLSLKSVHRFGWFRTFLIFLIPQFTVLISIALYLSTGVMVSPPP